jgi:hypothetical protein
VGANAGGLGRDNFPVHAGDDVEKGEFSVEFIEKNCGEGVCGNGWSVDEGEEGDGDGGEGESEGAGE